MKPRVIGILAVGLCVSAGCGQNESRTSVAPSVTPLERRVTTCLIRAGATLVRDPSDLDFAKGTSLYGDAPSAGTDVVSVAHGHASVSFMPDDGSWRIYTLSDLADHMDPDYDAIWALVFDHPEKLEVVAYARHATQQSPAQRCMDIFGGPDLR